MIVRKIIKIVAIRGAFSAPPDPLDLRGPTSKGREGPERRGKDRMGGEREGAGRGGGQEEERGKGGFPQLIDPTLTTGQYYKLVFVKTVTASKH